MQDPGLQRYWVPSVPGSALFGTRFADEFFAIHTGGDIAFINGVLRHLIENRWVDDDFIEKHTTGFYPVRVEVASQTWEDRKSTRLNSSHVKISYAVFCLKKKKSMAASAVSRA